MDGNNSSEYQFIKETIKERPVNRKKILMRIIMVVICLGLTLLFAQVMNRYKNGEQKEITYNEFLTMLINEGAVGLLCYGGIFVTFLISMGKNTVKNQFALLGILIVGGYLVNDLFAFQQVLSTPFVFLIMGMLDSEMKQYKS